MRHPRYAAILVLLLTAPAAAAPAGPPGLLSTPPASLEAVREKREPTAGQLAARERMRKCGMEWREAKKARTTGEMKWPQYWKSCNARLKGNQA